jgi:hypothetical protein
LPPALCNDRRREEQHGGNGHAGALKSFKENNLTPRPIE